MMYIYILRCTDDSLYTGIARDMEKRIRQHLGMIKGGARYTRSHPVKYAEILFETDSDTAARKLEAAVKKLSREKKEMLISSPEKITTEYITMLNEYNYVVCDTTYLNEMIRSACSVRKQ